MMQGTYKRLGDKPQTSSSCPRDESELEIVLKFIGESISYARENILKA